MVRNSASPGKMIRSLHTRDGGREGEGLVKDEGKREGRRERRGNKVRKRGSNKVRKRKKVFES